MKYRGQEQRREMRSTQGIRILYLVLLFILFYSMLPSLSSADTDEIQSRAAVVMDATTGRVLYAKNPNLRLLPASTTKLMTAIVVVERAKLTNVTTVSKRAAGQPASRVGLKAGQKFTLENLLYAALMTPPLHFRRRSAAPKSTSSS
jgi:D-alanyl-D-alanine carboxypeptidase (penicillin-binding protein 5/6)